MIGNYEQKPGQDSFLDNQGSGDSLLRSDRQKNVSGLPADQLGASDENPLRDQLRQHSSGSGIEEGLVTQTTPPEKSSEPTGDMPETSDPYYYMRRNQWPRYLSNGDRSQSGANDQPIDASAMRSAKDDYLYEPPNENWLPSIIKDAPRYEMPPYLVADSREEANVEPRLLTPELLAQVKAFFKNPDALDLLRTLSQKDRNAASLLKEITGETTFPPVNRVFRNFASYAWGLNGPPLPRLDREGGYNRSTRQGRMNTEPASSNTPTEVFDAQRALDEASSNLKDQVDDANKQP